MRDPLSPGPMQMVSKHSPVPCRICMDAMVPEGSYSSRSRTLLKKRSTDMSNAYDQAFQRSIQDPEGFWGELAEDCH
ncbi:MAG: hypothetical protein ACOC0T_02585, partial [Desulfovermiculus sp.]